MRNLNLTLWNAIRECWSSVSDSDSDSELDSICSLGFRSHHPLRLRLIHGLKLRYSNWDFQTLRPAHFMLVDRLSAAASLISHLQLPNCLRSVDLICILNMLISYDGLQRSERVLEGGGGSRLWLSIYNWSPGPGPTYDPWQGVYQLQRGPNLSDNDYAFRRLFHILRLFHCSCCYCAVVVVVLGVVWCYCDLWLVAASVLRLSRSSCQFYVLT